MMKLSELNEYYAKFKYGEDNFHNLMRKRVKEILLVSTFYDAYMFEHDGRLSDQIVGQYINLNLTTIPRITSVPTAEEALSLLDKNSYDLIITTPRIGKPGAEEFAAEVKKRFPKTPVILLLTVKSDIALVDGNRDYSDIFDNIFLWNGEPSIILAMIKYIEDRDNAAYDTENGLVQVILLVEDSIPFYSSFLPLLYKEIMQQTQKLISEEVNDVQKYHRMRTRPKVLLAHNYEEAITIYNQYKSNLLCVLSDIEFPREGILDPQAGILLCRAIREWRWDIPLVLQSTSLEYKGQAESVQADFLDKRSPTLLNELRSFIVSNLGFGDFVFRDEQGKVYARAHRIDDFERVIPMVPVESLRYHAARNNFSTWLIAHGEFQVARKLRPVQLNDFSDASLFKDYLIKTFRDVRIKRSRGKIIKYDPGRVIEENVILQMQEGSLGGKGRGLAFFNALLATIDFSTLVKGMRLGIPSTAVIGSVEYEEFIFTNNLYEIIDSRVSDEEVTKRFLAAELSEKLRGQLFNYLNSIKRPLAVRSSGLLEDSQTQPFAGIYRTYMLPNNSPSIKERFSQLEQAVKLVFSSVFRKETKVYLENLNFRVEEERMAVIIQEVVGNWYGSYYYPHLSGVAQSHNYYPITGVSASDGVAAVAVGLGQFVVEGERAYRFCPKYPLIQFMAQEDYLKYTQTSFYALDCSYRSIDLSEGEYSTLAKLDIEQAEKDGTLAYSASVWDAADHRIRDTLSIPGPRVVNFSNLLRNPGTPLPETLLEILDLSEKALGTPVEIEFAMNLPSDGQELPVFYLLQARPLFYQRADISKDRDPDTKGRSVLYSSKAMGNGIVKTIRDILFIPPEKFSLHDTLKIQREVEKLNEEFKDKGEQFILIGPGRWGSRDRFLGVPVTWSQISNVKLIVEYGLPEFHPEPSQGTHFFHLILSMGIGYVTIPYGSGDSFIDWEYLKTLPAVYTGEYCTRVSLREPLTVFLDGSTGSCRVINGSL